MIDVLEQVVDLVWQRSPDAAIEAGRLPAVLWEDVSEQARRTVRERCAAQLVAVERIRNTAGDVVVDAAAHHLRCVAIDAESAVPAMLNHMTGPVARLTWAAEAWPSALDPDGAVYLDRLRQFVPFCRAVVAASEPATSASRPVLATFIRQIDAAIEDNRGTAPPLLAPVPSASPAADEALAGVIDGLLMLRRQAVALSAAAASASPLAVSPTGRARYQAAIEQGTSTDLDHEQIEDVGRTLLAASEARFAELADDPRVPTEEILAPERALERFQSVHQALDAALGRVADHLPSMPCRVQPLPPAHSAVGPPAFYGPSSQRNHRPGTLFVNISPLARIHAWEVLPLAMHEGVPGHHLQIALLDESTSVPDSLRLLPVNAFTEGWAVYAETLAPAMGIEVGPAEEFGLLAHQRWRAGRLLVDVGLHVHGWSVAKATTVLAAVTRQDPRAVEREVIRYLAWPGQALGYAIGAEAIRKWIDRQVAAGSRLAAAHGRLLALGSVPLSALERHDR